MKLRNIKSVPRLASSCVQPMAIKHLTPIADFPYPLTFYEYTTPLSTSHKPAKIFNRSSSSLHIRPFLLPPHKQVVSNLHSQTSAILAQVGVMRGRSCVDLHMQASVCVGFA